MTAGGAWEERPAHWLKMYIPRQLEGCHLFLKFWFQLVRLSSIILCNVILVHFSRLMVNVDQIREQLWIHVVAFEIARVIFRLIFKKIYF